MQIKCIMQDIIKCMELNQKKEKEVQENLQRKALKKGIIIIMEVWLNQQQIK